ncbi:MAG: ParB N-terminal domain-containing protein [Planctomycetes bacterium]|nr:ParB N-terminal domain-containing protein [Planctomycetota bacterium]
MEIQLRNIDDIRPYEKNPRVNDQAVAAVAASLREYGFRQPIVVDAEGVIIVGHTRWKAAKKLGLTKVPVHVAKDLPPEKVKAYRIADNQTNALAEWDYELLPIELKELQAADYNLDLLGFSAEDLARILDPDGTQGLTDPDDVPAPPDEAITQPGDLWILGNHRLLCGDSAKPEDVDRLLDGAKIQLVNTDPPYNVKVASRSNNAIAATGDRPIGQQGMDMAIRGKTHATDKKLRAKDRPLVNDFVSDEEFARLLRAWFGNIQRVLEPGHSAYIWGGYSNIWNYPNALKECELYFSQMIIWVKEHPVLTRKDFMGNHEWCFYSWREGAAHRFFGPANITDVWSVKKVNPQSMIHLTEKPVELAVRAIQYSSLQGENVLDLFGGSGSTLIACEQTGRKAYLMEIDPLYSDVIVQRWEKFTGQKAKRIAGVARTETTPTVAGAVEKVQV